MIKISDTLMLIPAFEEVLPEAGQLFLYQMTESTRNNVADYDHVISFQ